MTRTIVVSSCLFIFFACIFIVLFILPSSSSSQLKSIGSNEQNSIDDDDDDSPSSAPSSSQLISSNDLLSLLSFSDDVVSVSSPTTCEIHSSTTTTTSVNVDETQQQQQQQRRQRRTNSGNNNHNNKKKKTRRRRMKIWKPKLCGSLWNLERTESFPDFDSVGWNITNGRRVVPDETRSISEKDRCAAYDTGVFVDVNKNQAKLSTSMKQEQPWRHASLPPAISIVSGNGNRLAPFEPKDLLGSNLASFISKRMFASTTSTSSTSSGSTTTTNNNNNRLPPWIVMIGDSRSRHLLLRLVMMIRSSFAPAAEMTDDGENAIHAEMRRHGAIEHYFHLDATYTVFGRVIDEETGEMEPTSDRFHILPEGFGCPADDVAMTGKDEKNCPSSSEKENNNNSDKIRIMFRICLWWHASTFAFLQRGPQFLGKDLGEVGAVTWMPTLHECMRAGNHTQCRLPPHVMRESVAKSIKIILNETNAKNFVILSTPDSPRAPKNIVAEQNQHIVRGLNEFVAEMERKPSATIRPLTIFGSDEVNNSKKKNKNKNDRTRQQQQQQQQQRQVWYLDMANWWVAAQPTVCDTTHTMCSLNPKRPKRAERVPFFCGGCRDEMGFVSMREILRLLLA